MHIRAKHAAENLTNLVERELAGEGHDALRRISLMAAEQIRSDRRTEKRFGPRRTILTAAQGLRFFSESPVALPILLFQCHATAKMRGCLSAGGGRTAQDSPRAIFVGQLQMREAATAEIIAGMDQPVAARAARLLDVRAVHHAQAAPGPT